MNSSTENEVIESKLAASRLASRENNLKKILEKLFAQPALPQVDRFLAIEFAKNKKYGSKDRKWYSEQIFFIVRNLYFILYLLSSRTDTLSSRGLTAGSSSLEKFTNEITNPKTFWNAVQQLSFEDIRDTISSSDLMARSLQNSLDPAIESRDDKIQLQTSDKMHTQLKLVQASIPLWLESSILNRFTNSDDLDSFLVTQNTRPPIWIRLNHPEKRADVLNDFTKNGLEFKTYENQNYVSISGAKSIQNLESFNKGFFEIQDYASQEIGNALTLKPGDCVWDVCAGGGGKTVQIASILKNKGVVYATDIREHKLDEIKKRIKKAQFYNVRALLWDGKIIPNFPKEIQNNRGFDCVLVDAPCSSSGTWRRRPDEKYKIGDVKCLTEMQFSILSTVHSMVKVGGQLAYATCSFFKEENEDIIQKFLHEHSNFKLVRMNMLGFPHEDSDTMFVAVLERTS